MSSCADPSQEGHRVPCCGFLGGVVSSVEVDGREPGEEGLNGERLGHRILTGVLQPEKRLLKRGNGDAAAPPSGSEGLLELCNLAVDVAVAVDVERADAVDQVAQTDDRGRQGPAIPLEAADGGRHGLVDDAAELADDAGEEVVDLPHAALGDMALEFCPEREVPLDLRLPGLLARELAR